MFSFTVIGIVLGLSAGFAPGPLLALVVSETLQHGIRAGVRVALAPLLTDLPIIAIALLVLAKLSDFQIVLGCISIVGACFVLYMGCADLRTKGPGLVSEYSKSRSLQKGIAANLLNPHPYLFWFSVGAPTTIRGADLGLHVPLLFVGSFYVMLVGAKVFLAVLVGRSRSFMAGNVYLSVIRILGGLLVGFACLLFLDGLRLIGLL